jgi:hypothetical protein
MFLVETLIFGAPKYEVIDQTVLTRVTKMVEVAAMFIMAILK